MKYLDQLKKLDLFGVSFNPDIIHEENQFKSYLGGLISFIIYTSSLIYTIIVLIQWQNNQIPPIITSNLKKGDGIILNTDESLFKFNFIDPNESIMSPFKNQGRILRPRLFDFQSKQYFDNDIREINDSIVIIPNLRVNQSYGGYSLIFQRCENLTENTPQNYCASDYEIDSWLNISLIRLKSVFNIQQYDYQSQKISKQFIEKIFFQVIQNDQILYNQINIKTSIASIQNGFITNNYDEIQYVSDYELQTQQLNQNKLQFLGSSNIYAFQLIQLQNVQQVNQIQYPQLGQVLASIGSLISLLMFMQYIAIIFNNKKMEEYLCDSIIKQFYPEFKLLEIKKNIKGQIFYVGQNDIEYDSQNLNKVYQDAKVKVKKKLNILNIIYEISRIQFLLQSLLPRENFQYSKQIGIKLNLQSKKSPIQHLKICIKNIYNNNHNIQEPQFKEISSSENKTLVQKQELDQKNIFQFQLRDSDLELLMYEQLTGSTLILNENNEQFKYFSLNMIKQNESFVRNKNLNELTVDQNLVNISDDIK